MNIQKYNKNKLLEIHSSSNQLSILIRYNYIENLSIPYYVSIYWKENTLAVGSHCHLTKPKKNKKNLKTSLSLSSKLFMCPSGHRFKFHKEESCAALCPNINSISVLTLCSMDIQLFVKQTKGLWWTSTSFPTRELSLNRSVWSQSGKYECPVYNAREWGNGLVVIKT